MGTHLQNIKYIKIVIREIFIIKTIMVTYMHPNIIIFMKRNNDKKNK